MAQSLVPPTDVRIPYAMETHGVEVSLLQSQPSEVRHLCSHSKTGHMSVAGSVEDGAASEESDCVTCRRRDAKSVHFDARDSRGDMCEQSLIRPPLAGQICTVALR